MVNDDNPNLDPLEGAGDGAAPEGAADEARQQPGSQESPFTNAPFDSRLPDSPVVEAADFLGLDDELNRRGEAPEGAPTPLAGSASSWLFQEDSERDGPPVGQPAAEPGSPALPTKSIEGSWLMEAGIGETPAPAPQPPASPPTLSAPPEIVVPLNQSAPPSPADEFEAAFGDPPPPGGGEKSKGSPRQSWLLDPERTRAAGAPAGEGGEGQENWLLDLDEASDDGTRPVGPMGEVQVPEVAGLDASYHEPPPPTAAVKSVAPKVLLATCLGVLAVAGYKLTIGMKEGKFVDPEPAPPVVAQPQSTRKPLVELDSPGPIERTAAGGSPSSGGQAGHSFEANLDPARQSYSRMRQPWIRKGGRTHKEPGELEAFANEDYPVAGATSRATIFVFPPPPEVLASRVTLLQLNTLAIDDRPSRIGDDLELALAEYPGFEDLATGAASEYSNLANAVELNLPPSIAWQWGLYLAEMRSELEAGRGPRARALVEPLGVGPHADSIVAFGERGIDPHASFEPLGFVASAELDGESGDESSDVSIAAIEDAWYTVFEGPLAESPEVATTEPAPRHEDTLLARLALAHGFDAPEYFVAGPASGELAAFPPRLVRADQSGDVAAWVVPGDAPMSARFGEDVGPLLEPLGGRDAILARLLPAERSPLDQYYDWRRDGFVGDPRLEYVQHLGHSSSIPPRADEPWRLSTVETTETYLSSLGPYPAGAVIALPVEPARPIEPGPPVVATAEPPTVPVEPAEPSAPKGLFGMPKLTPSSLRRADPKDRWLEESIPHHALHASAPLKTPRVGRVRAVFDSGEVFEGRLWAVGQDRIWVDTDLGRMTFDSEEIVKLERMVGEGTGEVGGPDKTAGLPRIRVWVPGGVIVGHQVSRRGNEVVILTEEGRMTLKSDRIESANTRRTLVARKAK